MTETNKKSLNSFATSAVLRLLISCVFLLPITACVTTSEKQSDSNADTSQDMQTGKTQQARKTCGASIGQNSNTDSKSKPAHELVDSCAPKGVIQIIENHKLDPEVQQEFDKAVGLLKEENYEEAIRLLKSVAAKAPKFTAPHINLGIAYVQVNDLEKAEESLRKALELNYMHPVARNEMGLVYRQSGRYEEARKLYESLLKMHPDFLPARKNFGVLCDIYLQDLSCALEQYQVYLEGIPEDEKVKIWVADVKSRM